MSPITSTPPSTYFPSSIPSVSRTKAVDEGLLPEVCSRRHAPGGIVIKSTIAIAASASSKERSSNVHSHSPHNIKSPILGSTLDLDRLLGWVLHDHSTTRPFTGPPSAHHVLRITYCASRTAHHALLRLSRLSRRTKLEVRRSQPRQGRERLRPLRARDPAR